MLVEFSIKQEVYPAGDSEENESRESSQKRSPTNFSIDEILKPEFGRRRSSLSPSSSSPSPQPQDLTNKGTRREAPPSSSSSSSSQSSSGDSKLPWPAWVYCTRYSDRPSSGPRCRKPRRKAPTTEEKRPRTAFSSKQLQKLRQEFENNRYLCEQRRQALARELNLNESQVKIWFQNKRAKLKKSSGVKNGLALHLMAEGLYNHSTIVIKDDEDHVQP